MFYALIMAGGSGTRLWPLSRKSRPKQALPLIDNERSMFQVTVDRIAPLISAERVFVVTNAQMADIFRAQLPDLPAENFIIEPSAKDSGPAAALGLAHIHHRDPQAIVAILAADHFIGKVDDFLNALQSAHDIAQEGYIVTLGIEPSQPATGFGYIERAEPLKHNSKNVRAYPAYRAARFTEKPSLEIAKEYLAGGNHSWNSGMFILSSATGLAEFERQQIDFYQHLVTLQNSISTPDYENELKRTWDAAPKKSLDFAIMEGAQKIAVIPVEIGWSDIGSWASLLEVIPPDEHGNVVIGDHIGIDTGRSLVRSEHRTIVTIGVNDVLIIDTPDALLVCHKDRAQEVKAVVDQLHAKGKRGLT
jgi:mannose-1-phosphate guanylyltransferase